MPEWILHYHEGTNHIQTFYVRLGSPKWPKTIKYTSSSDTRGSGNTYSAHTTWFIPSVVHTKPSVFYIERVLIIKQEKHFPQVRAALQLVLYATGCCISKWKAVIILNIVGKCKQAAEQRHRVCFSSFLLPRVLQVRLPEKQQSPVFTTLLMASTGASSDTATIWACTGTSAARGLHLFSS